MTTRAAGWTLFAVFALTVPLPAFGPLAEFAPAVRHLSVLAATGAVAATEGAAGPVPGILALLAFRTALSLALAGLLAFVAARLLAPRPPGVRRAAVLAVCVALLAVSLAFHVYRTPFGHAPTANLLGLLS